MSLPNPHQHKDHLKEPGVSNEKNEHRDKELSDVELWNAFREGSETAFATIYKRNITSLFSYGLKQVRNKDLVRDAIHDLFVELWDARERMGEVHNISHYLLKSIRRKVIYEAVRQGKKSDLPVTEVLQQSSTPSAEHSLMEKQEFDRQRKIIKRALDQLNPRQREIIFLKYHCRIRYREIAEIMDTDKTAVYNLMAKTMKKLREHLKF